jgi:hypothetical protein
MPAAATWDVPPQLPAAEIAALKHRGRRQLEIRARRVAQANVCVLNREIAQRRRAVGCWQRRSHWGNL